MKAPPKDKAAVARQQAEQMRQRVRVGMIGLAAIVLLIGLASAIFSSVNRQQPVNVTGSAQPDLVANMSASASAPGAAPTNEPLAEMGVTPGAAPTPQPPTADTPPSPQQQPQPQPAPDPAASGGTL